MPASKLTRLSPASGRGGRTINANGLNATTPKENTPESVRYRLTFSLSHQGPHHKFEILGTEASSFDKAKVAAQKQLEAVVGGKEAAEKWYFSGGHTIS